MGEKQFFIEKNEIWTLASIFWPFKVRPPSYFLNSKNNYGVFWIV